MNGEITINGSAIPMALFTLLRQGVLTVSGYALGKGALDGDVIEAIAWVLIFGGTLAYGQIKGWLNHKKTVALAEAAPNATIK